MNIERIDSGPRMSQAAVVGNLVFTAGQVAEANAGRDVGSQTREILDGIDALLARAGHRQVAHRLGQHLARRTSSTSTR